MKPDIDKQGVSDVNFSLLFASSIHDMKNSLGMVLSSIEKMHEEVSQGEDPTLATLHYEASRVSNELIHLLGLYRIENERFPLCIDEYYVLETIDEAVIKNNLLFLTHLIEISVKCDDELMWFYDNALIAGVLNNVIVNAVRYTKKRIIIEAVEVDGFLKISVSDDGCGFPENMRKDPGGQVKNINFSTGSTSMGLYFAEQIAAMHCSEEREGYLSLENGGSLGGGVFNLFLP